MMELDQEIVDIFCDEALDLLVKWESLCFALTREQQTQESLQELFRYAHNLKGGSKSVGLSEFGEFVHRIEDGITLVRDGKFPMNDYIQTLFLDAQKIMVDWISALKNKSDFPNGKYKSFITDYISFFKSENATAVAAAPADSVIEKSEPQMEIVTPVTVTNETDVAKQKTTGTPVANNKRATLKTSRNVNETIRISAQRLDQLIQSIGELSIHQSILWHTKSDNNSSNRVFANSMQLSQKLTKELHDKALSLRMQPLGSVFQRLERTILDLSKAQGKAIQVFIDGSDVELDKTVIEQIIDPLAHIVRNGVDHGIEKTADRIIDGKPEFGKIEILAHQDAFGVVITIKDDGKGLSTEKIFRKAEEKKLVDPNLTYSKEEIFQFIFLPGFSTSENITEVSGRGVGMNVVSTTLNELHGQIKIDSEVGQGTTFTITLPTSVSIIEAMIVKLSGQNYVIPVGTIEEVVNMKDLKLKSDQKVFQLRDQIVPFQDLNEILVNKKIKGLENPTERSLLITKNGRDKIGFAVDQVLGQQQIVIRPLNDIIDGAYGLMGGTILGNGEPGLIVDIPFITNEYLNKNKSKEIAA